MTVVLIMAAVYCFRAIQKYATKKASTLLNEKSTLAYFCLCQFAISALLSIISVLASGGFAKLDFAALFYGTLSGVAILLSTACTLLAMKNGTVSLVTLFSMAGLIVPCLANQLFFGRPMSLMQWVGILLFLLAAYLLVASSKRIFGAFSLKALLLLVVALLSEGFTMLLQQLFAEHSSKPNIALFTFISFFAVTLLMLPVSIIVSSAEKKGSSPKPTSRRLIFPVIAAAASVWAISILVTYAVALSSPVVVFSLSAGGGMLISALIGWLCFKERLTAAGYAGILLGIVAMIFIKAFEI